ncbi:MAG TPA: flagellar protein FlgN [Noviherbaspirillum sp.]|uniref:flagella synthesis protein FlgN n=1 Tax=Noviherbaspirillum sp. TaxID=1926288 RepID=UPI002B492E1D|nr:flagellar protein FlgN [Noviherbaspirillum sp.]HJV88477.1 flagellar protein FlgN [Noviherbaspirillum sp.]
MQTPGKNPAEDLGDEIKESNVLLQLLKDEQEVLIRADVKELARLTEEKNKSVARMGELAQRRHRVLAAAGFEASEAGMKTWLKTAGPAIARTWTNLLELAQQAKELNRINGLLIGKHMARTQAALNVLHGAPQGGNMYGPNGQSTGQGGSRKLVIG